MHSEKASFAEKLQDRSIHLTKGDVSSMRTIGLTVDPDPRQQLKIVETMDGRRFCELRKDPETQAVAALLIKPVVPACDIVPVEIDGQMRYFSYMAPVGDISSAQLLEDELLADNEVTALLFSDGEHYVQQDGRYKNIRVDLGGRAILFDFDMSRIDKSLSYTQARAFIANNIEKKSQHAASLLENKLVALQGLYEGERGERLFYRILQRARFETFQKTELSEKQLFERFCSNITTALEALRAKPEELAKVA